MAKLRSVTGPLPLPRSEGEFLSGAPIALPENGNTSETDERIESIVDDDLVTVTIRLPRRQRDALAERADAEERSISQIARRLLAPLLG